MSDPGSKPYIVKMLIVGQAGVGKTSILLRYVDNTFSDNLVLTIGIDFKIKVKTYEEETLKLQIWDSAGGERFRHPTTSHYRGSSAVLLVFDTSSRESFEFLTEFRKEMMERCIPVERPVLVVLVGNKTDLDRQVERSEAEEFAKDQPGSIPMIYQECSAATGEGVEEVFEAAIERIRNTPELWDNVYRPADRKNNQKGRRCFGCCFGK